jgi:glycosyltransferase involved in cell wall biosynthesis
MGAMSEIPGVDARAIIPEVSVVIPTYRRPGMLARCLEALVDQDFKTRRFEIIVCDDGPDDETRNCVQIFARDHRRVGCTMKYVPVTATQGPAGARNCGWKAASASVVAFTDDDTIPDRGWLREGLRAMESGAGAAAGRIKVPLCDQPTDYELDAAGLGASEFATANCFVRRSLLVKVGGFDERYTAAWREDSDLQFSLLEAGATIVRAECAVVEHPVRPARWGISVGQQKKSQFDALLYKKHRRYYRARIPPPPWMYYLVTLSSIAAIAGVLCGIGAVALAGLAGWIVLAGLFACQRLRRTSHAPSHVTEMIATSFVIPPLSVFWRLYGAYKFKVGFW